MKRPKSLKAAEAYLSAANMAFPVTLESVPPETWPVGPDRGRFHVWRSRGFLVQAFHEIMGVVRLSICRTKIDLKTGRWVDGITWDELQRLKAEAGYADKCAVEVYPPDADIVNVGNLRHLWILPAAPEWSWKRGQS